MTLRETIEQYKGTNKTLCIGSQSAYFYNGTAENWEAEAEKYNNAWYAYFMKLDTNHRRRVKNMLSAPIFKKPDETPEQYAERLCNLGDRLKEMLELSEKYAERIDNFKPMMNREVTQVNTLIRENNIGIIVEGDEQGSFWDIDEWNATDNHLPKIEGE